MILDAGCAKAVDNASKIHPSFHLTIVSSEIEECGRGLKNVCKFYASVSSRRAKVLCRDFVV
jgi:hypothetical protein